ncbi:hypothetical protein XENTR_v10000748 [Xenopus tropicalis]|nr:hypothetical protein XENTR_v10000748 [Xenopus tropicalis]
MSLRLLSLQILLNESALSDANREVTDGLRHQHSHVIKLIVYHEDICRRDILFHTSKVTKLHSYPC